MEIKEEIFLNVMLVEHGYGVVSFGVRIVLQHLLQVFSRKVNVIV